MQKLVKVIRFSSQRKKLILIIFFLSFYIWLLDKLRRTQVRPELFKTVSSCKSLTEDQILLIRDITYSIRLVAKYVPWTNVCRHQSWLAAYMLNKAGIGFDYYVGVKKDNDGKFEGHSWVTSGRYFVSGKCNPVEYTIIGPGSALFPKVVDKVS